MDSATHYKCVLVICWTTSFRTSIQGTRQGGTRGWSHAGDFCYPGMLYFNLSNYIHNTSSEWSMYSSVYFIHWACPSRFVAIGTATAAVAIKDCSILKGPEIRFFFTQKLSLISLLRQENWLEYHGMTTQHSALSVLVVLRVKTWEAGWPGSTWPFNQTLLSGALFITKTRHGKFLITASIQSVEVCFYRKDVCYIWNWRHKSALVRPVFQISRGSRVTPHRQLKQGCL